jgi:hypothetical protein
MADTEETTAARPASGILDPTALSFVFGGNTNLTLEEIQRRRAIAAALASRQKGYPKTIGEGMTYAAEAFADAAEARRLAAAEKDYNARFNTDASKLVPGGAPAPAAPAARPAAAAPGGGDLVSSVVSMFTGGGARPAVNPTVAGAVPSTPPPIASPNATSPIPAGPTTDVSAGGGGAGETVVDGPNPPTPTDIRPVMMAQARRPAAGAPAAGPPAAPVQPPAAVGGALAPVIPPEQPMPGLSTRDETMTPSEMKAWELMRKYPNDPRAKEIFTRQHELGKAARDAEWERKKREDDVRIDIWKQQQKDRADALRNQPKTTQDLQKGASEVTEAQEKERIRLTYGSLPAPVAKTLDESKDTANLSVRTLDAINNARIAREHAVSGIGADAKLLWYRARAATGNPEASRIVQASETYRTNLVPIMQQMLKSLAGKDVSTKEMEFIKSVSGADLSLNADSAERMMAIAERFARQDLKSHKDTVETMLSGQPASALPILRKSYEIREPMPGTPLENTRPAEDKPAAKRYREGDIARGRPGQPDLVFRDGKWRPL